MGNRESNDPQRNQTDFYDESNLGGQRYVTGGNTFRGHITNRYDEDDDDIPIPPPYIPDDLMNNYADDNLPVSPESEVEIPVFDEGDSHSTPVTQLTGNNNPNFCTAEAESFDDNADTSYKTQFQPRKITPYNVAVYIDKDDQISPVQEEQMENTRTTNSPNRTTVNQSRTSSASTLTSLPDDQTTNIRKENTADHMPDINPMTTGGITRSNSVISSNSASSELQSHMLPPLAYQRLRNCLLSLPLEEGQEIKEKAVERVASHVLIQDYEAKCDILMKGDSAKGIFIIIEGSVNVVSENGTDVLATLQEGDYFGEISVLFNCPCTARVQTVTTSQFAVLEVNVARRLLHKVDIDIIDYFVARKYLPTSDYMDVSRTQRRMVLTCLKELPIFEQWSEAAVKELIMQIKTALVILYQEKTVVVFEQDPPVAIHVIIRGRAVIKKDNKTIVEIDADKHPAVIGEEGMHLGYSSAVTIQTLTCCQIILIREECIENVLNKYTSEASDIWKSRELKWRALVNRNNELYRKFPHLLQFEVLYNFLKNHRIFLWCSPKCVQHLVLRGNPSQYLAGDTVCDQQEYDENVVVLVLEGEIEWLTDPDIRFAYTINTGDIFYRCDWMGNKGEIVARSDCLVLKIDQTEINEALELFKDSQLVLPSEPM